MSRNRYFVQKEGLRKEGCFFVKGRFSYERNNSHIQTGTKQLQMSFYTLGITYLKIIISKIIVFLMSRNRYFAQKEGLLKEGYNNLLLRKEDFI